MVARRTSPSNTNVYSSASLKAYLLRHAANVPFATVFRYVLAFNIATLLFLFSSCVSPSDANDFDDLDSSAGWWSVLPTCRGSARLFKNLYPDNDLLPMMDDLFPTKQSTWTIPSLASNSQRYPYPKPNSSAIPFPKPDFGGFRSSAFSNSPAEVNMNELLASKLFGRAFHRLNITPYYIVADRTPLQDEVTMTTHITADRLEVFMKMVGRDLGPISCTLHLDDDEYADRILAVVQQLREISPLMRRNVDIHVVKDSFGRQYNLWRNMARFFARSDFFMLLDVDFSVRTDVQRALRLALDAKISPCAETLRSGEAALVLPAFEYLEPSVEPVFPDPQTFEPGVPEFIRATEKEFEGTGVAVSAAPPKVVKKSREASALTKSELADEFFPADKKTLMRQVDSGRITMFHAKWRRGHGPTDYARWYESSQPYVVTEYEAAYEPYLITKKDALPWCEERFVGYGANKAACVMQMYISGLSFWIAPDSFVIHQAHGYPEENRRLERPHNRILYQRYFHENCFERAREFLAAGLWNSPRAYNLRRECGKKVKRFEEQVDQFFGIPAA